jgi:predicted permease
MMPDAIESLGPELDAQYQIVRELGRGAFARVYLARERVLHRLVAIKVLEGERAADERERERFLREARTAAHLDHPGIVPVLGFGETGSTMYIVMRYVDGETIAGRLARDGRLDAADVQRLLIEVGSALGYAHRQGIVHRDLKPENVLLASDSSAPSMARLLDFGVAAFRTRDLGVGSASGTWGTPTFMSPEQLLGEIDLDARSDIYSLGLMGYVMLAGREPFPSSNPMERLRRQQLGPMVALAKLAPNAPAALVAAIERCLAYDPSDRWRRADDFVDAVIAAGDTRSSRRMVERPRQRRRRRTARRAAFFSSRPSPRLIAKSLGDDARYAARSLTRTIGFTVAAASTFAIGIGANATMFGVIDRVLFEQPSYVAAPDRVLRLAVRPPTETQGGQTTMNYPLYKAIRDGVSSFAAVAGTAYAAVPYGTGADAKQLNGLLVTANYFSMLGAHAARGRYFLPDEDAEPVGAPVVVISDELWRRQFARDSAIVSKTLELGARRYTIVGVAPPGFTGTEYRTPDVWIPISSATGMQFPGPDWATVGGATTWLLMYARLKPGVGVRAASSEMTQLVRARGMRPWSDTLVAMTGDNLIQDRREHAGAGEEITLLLGGMAMLVMLIACANVANLLLARGLRRRREIAIRLALGVSRSRLAAQFLVESLMLALLGAAAALVLAQAGGLIVRRLLFSDLSWTTSPVDARVLAFTAFAALVSGLLAGVLPAVLGTRSDLTDTLKTSGREGGGRRARSRTVLLAAQAALSVVLLVAAGLFTRSLNAANTLHFGVDPDRTIVGRMRLDAAGRTPREIGEIFRQMRDRVAAVPGVAGAAIATSTPFSSSSGTDLIVPGQEALSASNPHFVSAVTPGYFRVVGTRLLAGRDFQATDGPAAPISVIVSDTLAKTYWPHESAIGKCVKVSRAVNPCARIVGVVENVARQNINEPPREFIYVSMASLTDWTPTDLRIVARSADGVRASSLLPSIQRAMQTAIPGLPHGQVGVLRESYIANQLRRWEIGAKLFSGFGAMAVLLASVGLYGVISYSVTQRTHEMGVRIALGAPPRAVARMVIGDGVRVTVAGVAIGLAVALATAKFTQSLLFHISARDPIVYATVTAVLLAVAAAASYVPARRAMRVDPAVALRAE